MTRYLALGAHPDDIEIGCGATLFSILKPDDKLKCLTMSKVDKVPGNENIVEEWKNALKYLKWKTPCDVDGFIYDYPNGGLRDHHLEIRQILDNELTFFKPDIVFTTNPNDFHKDHKALGEESISTFRNTTILTYDFVRSSSRILHNYYYVLREGCTYQANILISFYKCQQHKPELDPKLILATFRHKGGEIRQKNAQAFNCIRTVIK